eukprot:SAG31_NODE_23572_length_501_cov_1.131841_2_plen_55_part_01
MEICSDWPLSYRLVRDGSCCSSSHLRTHHQVVYMEAVFMAIGSTNCQRAVFLLQV